MILNRNFVFIMEIMDFFWIYAWTLIVHFCSILRNIELYFSLIYPKRYILVYLFMKLDKSARIIMPIFNGCRTKLAFFTAWFGIVRWIFCSSKGSGDIHQKRSLNKHHAVKNADLVRHTLKMGIMIFALLSKFMN